MIHDIVSKKVFLKRLQEESFSQARKNWDNCYSTPIHHLKPSEAEGLKDGGFQSPVLSS